MNNYYSWQLKFFSLQIDDSCSNSAPVINKHTVMADALILRQSSLRTQ